MLAKLSKSIQGGWYRYSTPNPLLLPFAWLYGKFIELRREAYRSGRFSTVPSPVPVIVVGNITAGGTGKSPFAGWLATQLAASGYRPGIVSRGYGGSYSGKPTRVGRDSDALEVGDEPVMLAIQTGLPVCVAHDRAAAVAELADGGCNVIVSDDGLQHYRMERCCELVVIDSTRGFGNGALLPAGPLREPQSRIEDVDAVVVNGAGGSVAGTEFTLVPGDAWQLNDKVSRPLQEFAGKRVWAVAGIGNPQRFYDVLTEAGMSVDEVEVPDHGRCELAKLVAQRRQPILMTQKDAVKYRVSDAPNTWYVPVELRIEPASADELLAGVIERIGRP